MREEEGNIWTYPAEYRCVTTNGQINRSGELVMGAGVALQCKQRFPALPKKLGEYVKKWGNRPFICKEEKIITFPTKYHWKDDSDIKLIEKSAKLIVEIVDKFSIMNVVSCWPGCGLGCLQIDDVRKVISSIFDDRFIVINY